MGAILFSGSLNKKLYLTRGQQVAHPTAFLLWRGFGGLETHPTAEIIKSETKDFCLLVVARTNSTYRPWLQYSVLKTII